MLIAIGCLVEPKLRTRSAGLDLFVLVDRSASARQAMADHLQELEQILVRSKGPHDRLVFVDYAREPARRSESAVEEFTGDPSRTATALAVRSALAAMDGGRASRILLVTDGFATEPVSSLADRLIEQDVALDFRLVSPPDALDFRVGRFEVPERVQIGEPVLLSIEVLGSADAAVPFTVLRDGSVLHRGTAGVRLGRAFARLSDRAEAPGGHRYEVRLDPVEDAHRGNDRVSRWVEVTSGPRVLLVTSYTDDPLAAVIRAQGFEVDAVTDLSSLHVGRLSGARGVIFDDVPAHRIPPDLLRALDFYVRSQGGGFLMTGGKNSFGAGGYFGSAVDPLLPVAMDMRQEHRKLAVAMVIVMDRSGSMAAVVPSGAGKPVTKMELANAGAAHAIELLGPADQVAVFAVDSSPHRIVGLTTVGTNRDELVDAVGRVGSMGGGIFVFEGLDAAWKELQDADVGQRHVILFSDAADSEEPGDYVDLIREMRGGNATISVIGMGTKDDVDAKLLEDIAARGGGRIFFTNDATELPGLFAQETVTVARSAFIEEAVGTRGTAGFVEIAARPLEWPASVDGYNLSYLRPEATASLVSTDEYEAPLIAHWQRGLGRVAAVSFPMAGPRSESVRAWKAYGDFAQTLVRWSAGADVPAGLGLRTQVDGTELELELTYGKTWTERMAKAGPKLVVADERGPREVPWRRMGPGRYAAEVPLESDAHVRGVVQVAGHALPFGPVNAGSSVEWDFDPRRIRELRDLARASGGAERTNIAEVFDAPRPESFAGVSWVLAVSFLVVVLFELLADRLGWDVPELRLPRRGRAPVPLAAPAPEAVAAPPEVEDASADRRRRFDRARKR
jgi:hypothetical protein